MQLDIALINGFSGASNDINIYVMGLQDHLLTDYYDASVGKTTHQHISEENDGALIDKFNNNLIITDRSSFNGWYYTSTNGSTDFESPSLKNAYLPDPTPNYYFEPGDPLEEIYTGQHFGFHPFFQAPFRSNRIYNTNKNGLVCQFDPISNKFVAKVSFRDESAQFTNSPTLKSEVCNGCLPNPNKPLNYIGWQSQPVGISFSQLDKNSMYVITYNDSKNLPLSAAQVIKYIGNDVDDLWTGHNEHQDAGGNPQWQLMTPTWNSAALVPGISDADVYHIRLTGVETSNWNKNNIYVSCASDLGGFPIKMIKGDCSSSTPVWVNYSTGIPADEGITSMIMDHASNDGIYASTEKGVYYRDASMSSWVAYKSNMPIMRSTQMEINYKENTVRAGTYGRGIWKSRLACPSLTNITLPVGTVSGYKEANVITSTQGATGSTPTSTSTATILRGTTSVTLLPGFTAVPTNSTNFFQAFIHGCLAGSSTSTFTYYRTDSPQLNEIIQESTERKNELNELQVYPNPTSGVFTLLLGNDTEEASSVYVYNSLGEIAYSKLNISYAASELPIDLQSQKNGVYLIRVIKNNGEAKTVKIIKQ